MNTKGYYQSLLSVTIVLFITCTTVQAKPKQSTTEFIPSVKTCEKFRPSRVAKKSYKLLETSVEKAEKLQLQLTQCQNINFAEQLYKQAKEEAQQLEVEKVILLLDKAINLNPVEEKYKQLLLKAKKLQPKKIQPLKLGAEEFKLK